MKNFDTRVYSISDFLEWQGNGMLELNPDFQRRSVWSEKAKSYLIDTILRGRPIPKLIINTRLEKSRTIRVVVDGQQRLRAMIEFRDGAFVVSRAHNKDLAGKHFNDLSKELQREYLKYELGVDQLYSDSTEELLDIFARLNSYAVPLKKQELLNARYFGYFKHAAYDAGIRYVDYFIRSGVLSKSEVTRMGEAELAGDIIMAILGGIQSNKSLESFYKQYEDEEGEPTSAVKRFDNAMSHIGEMYPPEELHNTNWARVHLFYTLFTSVVHCLHGIGGADRSKRAPLGRKQIQQARVCLDEISSRYDDVARDLNNPKAPSDYKTFIQHSRRATTDAAVRVARTDFVCSKLQERLR